MQTKYMLFPSLLVWCYASVIYADEAPLFASDEVLKTVLNVPLRQIYSQRKLDKQLYIPGHISFVDGSGKTQRVAVQSRARGIFRRTFCTWPPLQLNFRKSEVVGTLFAGQDKLKLVGPCKKSNNYEQGIILEYLAYKAYATLTPDSFKTRMMRVTYADPANNKPWTRLSFVIEDEEEMAKRIGLKPSKVVSIKPSQLDQLAAARLELFQLMIGNNDYSSIRGPSGADCCHNVKLLKSKAHEKLVPVPYDFDMSGLVQAPYANPPERLPIKTVRKRYFTGICKSREDLNGAIAIFNEHKNEIMAIFAESPLLSEKNRKRNVVYMTKFFELLDSPARVEREIVGRCRGKKS